MIYPTASLLDDLMISSHWEHFEHKADIGVRGIGTSVDEAFEQAALAMSAIITDLSGIAVQESIDIECEGEDHEYLLVDWLNAVIYEMATRRMLFGRFEVHIEAGRLRAIACGEAIDIGRHQPAVEIKGATLSELLVEQRDGCWVAQCVVDV